MSTSGDTLRTPFWSVLAFTFINSLGTGVVTSGIFYLTKAGYGFGDGANFLLGVLLGITYIAGALAAGKGTRWLRDRLGISSRLVLAWLMVLLAGLCAVPMIAQWLDGDAPTKSAWPIWLMVGLYSPLTGVLWPMVESYLSGGKSGDQLRREIGIWNFTWSSSLVFAYWGVAPLIKDRPAEAVLALGLSHVISLALLMWRFAKEPAPHIHGEHAPHPPVYEQLLVTFRMLLPTSYVISSALGPYLPSVMPRLGVAPAWTTVLATAWLVPRALVFAWFGRWNAWHGRWWPAVAGAACLVLGFAGCTMAGLLGGPEGDAQVLGISTLIAGLFLYGTGMAIIYSGAIYYALEVGKAEVDAGGAHEALIGVGYTIGPLCGLGAWALVDRKIVGTNWFDPLVLATVGGVTLVVVALTIRRVRHMTKQVARPSRP